MPTDNEFTKILSWPGYRVYQHEIDEKAKTLKLWIRGKRGNRQGFRDFIVHHGCDILHPDLRNSGGLLETRRIADMADTFGLPMANPNMGSQLHTWATCQWAGSIRDYMGCETITGLGDWMDKLLVLNGPYIKNGFVQVTDQPGLGVEINPDVARAHRASGETWWG